VHDAAFFERRGVPAVPVVSEAFLHAGGFQARALFAEDYPLVWTPHPVVQLDRAGIRELAEATAGAIAARLVAPGG